MKIRIRKVVVTLGLIALSLGASQSVLAAAYVKPIDNGVITTGFNGYAGHTGVDYAASMGTAVRAVADGVVKFAGPGAQNSWMTWQAGNSILIQHGDGMHSGYAHLSRVTVKTGDRITQGTVIGYSGATGNVTGPHLHFELLPSSPNFRNGRAGRIDPTGYIANAPTFTGQVAAQPVSVTPVNNASVSANATRLKIYRVDDLQKINGVWLVKNTALVPAGFDWNDNGIPASEIDEVDANGNLTADQSLQRGGYFVFNPNRVSRVAAPIQGYAGYRWAKTQFANGRTSWFVVSGQSQLIYGQ